MNINTSINATEGLTVNVPCNSRSGDSDPVWSKVILDVIFFVIGFTGNVCLIFITLRFKSMRTVPNYLIINLAVVDLVFICMLIPRDIVKFLDVKLCKYDFYKSKGICSFYEYFKIVFLGVSIFTLTALSIDRYLAVSKPLACRMLRSGRRRLCAVLIGLAVIWSAALIAAFPVTEIATLWGDGHCYIGKHKPLYKTFTYITVVIFLLIPTVIISASYCCTARNLIKSNNLLQGQNAVQVSPRQRRQRLRLAIAIVIIVIVFVSTWGLSYGIDIAFIIDRDYNQIKSYSAIEVLNFVRSIMIRINSVVNPIILFIVSTSHRRYLKAAFCCCLPSQKDDRTLGKRLHKNTSITVHSSVESRFRKIQSDNCRIANISDHQV